MGLWHIPPIPGTEVRRPNPGPAAANLHPIRPLERSGNRRTRHRRAECNGRCRRNLAVAEFPHRRGLDEHRRRHIRNLHPRRLRCGASDGKFLRAQATFTLSGASHTLTTQNLHRLHAGGRHRHRCRQVPARLRLLHRQRQRQRLDADATPRPRPGSRRRAGPADYAAAERAGRQPGAV